MSEEKLPLKLGERGHWNIATRDKKLHQDAPIEKQFSPEEIGRIHAAIHFTHAVFGNEAERQLKNHLDGSFPNESKANTPLVDSWGDPVIIPPQTPFSPK